MELQELPAHGDPPGTGAGGDRAQDFAVEIPEEANPDSGIWAQTPPETIFLGQGMVLNPARSLQVLCLQDAQILPLQGAKHS